MALVSFVVSFCVVKAFAPCVVKQAMMKEFIEKQMDFEIFQSQMIKKMIVKKMEMEMMKNKMDKSQKNQGDRK